MGWFRALPLSIAVSEEMGKQELAFSSGHGVRQHVPGSEAFPVSRAQTATALQVPWPTATETRTFILPSSPGFLYEI
ncbi:UNVERIFIED_CONTAM: hypothetical protein FKN15_074128 [Acipenser sinensis]